MGKLKGSPKTGGRKKGTPNYASLPLKARADALGIDPWDALLHFVSGDWKSLRLVEGAITPAQRLQAASEACSYLYSKRKAIETDNDNGDDGSGSQHDETQELTKWLLSLHQMK